MPLEGHRDKPVVEELWRAAPTRAPFGPAAAQTTAMLFIQLLCWLALDDFWSLLFGRTP